MISELGAEGSKPRLPHLPAARLGDREGAAVMEQRRADLPARWKSLNPRWPSEKRSYVFRARRKSLFCRASTCIRIVLSLKRGFTSPTWRVRASIDSTLAASAASRST